VPAARRVQLVAVVAALVAASLALPSATASGTPGLSQRLSAALKGKWLSPGRTAAVAVDLRTGAVVYAHNARRPFRPASNEKLPVGWAALMRLGPDARFPTEVVGSGTRVGRIWRGDLVLKGYGDPTLSSERIGRLAQTLYARGIRIVTGGILGDETFFDARRAAPGWKRGFLGIESPPLSALVVDRALGWPASPPAVLAARALRQALQRRGVVVRGKAGTGVAPVEGERLAQTESAPLAELVRLMNSESDNFVAELVLKRLGTVDGSVGTTAGGAEVVLAELTAAGISTEGVELADGSGLSSDDRLTAEALAGVIRTALADPEIADTFRSSLAVAGRSGTLQRRYGLPRGAVRGKTGTTDLACTLAGIVRETYAFAVLENGDPVAYWAARGAQDRFVTLLAREAVTG
jgi:D-alanyl-D-alanine carboxypeptidase/D-alanyl-D-alanine-endopeptidase (penicillin-binding protein 4)